MGIEVHFSRTSKKVYWPILLSPIPVCTALFEVLFNSGVNNRFKLSRADAVRPREPVDVHLIKSGEPPWGVGEIGATAGPPALRNAIFAATGVALKRQPVDRSLLARSAKA